MTLYLTTVESIKKETSITDVNFGVMDFAHDLKKVMRGIEVAPKSTESMWVYRPQDTFAMGYIAYADFMDNGDGERRYSVFSPNIINNKYQHGERQHISSALRRDKAVKNAAKHLRPLTAEQVLKQVQSEFVSKAYEIASETRAEVQRVVNDFNRGSLFDVNSYRTPTRSPLYNELKHMVDSGHSFLDKDLEANLRAAFVAMDDFEESKQINAKLHTFVEAYQFGDQARFRGFYDVENARLAATKGEAFDYAQGELPEHLAGGISVLSMVDVGQYVMGVGHRAAANIFYVKCE